MTDDTITRRGLQGLFRLNTLVDTTEHIPAILEEFTLEILPGSMKYPDQIACRTEFGGKNFSNNNRYTKTGNSCTVPICINKEQRGNISISYPEKKMFTIEPVEHSVLRAFADKIGKAITRLEAQQQLSENKLRIQNILDSLPDIIFEIDRNMRVTWANKRALEVNGNALNQFCYTVYHNRNKPCPNCPAAKAFETGEMKRGSVYFSDDGGESEQYLENIGVPLRDQNGNIIGVIEIARDVTRSHQVREKLLRYNKELRNLSHHLQLIREEERKNISREIHDELGQALTAIKMDAYWLNKNIPETETALRKKTADLLSLADETVWNVQKLISDLRLGFPEDLDFRSSLEWEIEDFIDRTGMDVTFSLDMFPGNIDPQCSITAYRILQESLTNISRHAAAEKADIAVRHRDGGIEISISDNGAGISDKELYSPSSYGIIGMRERCVSIGGYLEIAGTPGEGTRLTARIPASPAEEEGSMYV
jgi:two-component system, NarL family, sensor histidine kinase UhpB